MNLIIFLSSYFLILLSLIGYSLVFQNILNKKFSQEFGYALLGTTLFWIVLSFFTHFFLSHNYFHNSLILILGFVCFLITIFKKKKLPIKSLKNFSIIFFILVFGLLAAKTHDDFPYYHFPYTYYLTQENLIIGTGILNHGFRTPSSIFYLNSIFYLPFIKYFSFSIGAVLIFGITNLILISKLIKDYQEKKYDFIFLLTLLSFLFINIFFYRISEHGTDRSAQILIFLLFIEILSLLRNRISLSNFFSKIFILLGIIISLKAFYVLYLLTLVPIFFYLKKINFKILISDFLKNVYFYFFFLTGAFLIIVNIFNTGCFLYPVEFTCLFSFEWSLIDQAESMNNWYEQWSKAGAGPNYRIDDPEKYIQGFNWVENWIDKYFFNKVSDFLLGILFLSLIVFLTFFSRKSKKTKVDKKILGFYAVIIILFFEWFYNHPSLRYGGFSLIALIFFIPLSIYISKFLSEKNLKIKLVILIMFSLIIFIGRNVTRINDEINKYSYDLIKKPFYIVDEKHFRIDKFISEIKKKYLNCKNENAINCNIHEGIEIKKDKSYFLLIKKK